MAVTGFTSPFRVKEILHAPLLLEKKIVMHKKGFHVIRSCCSHDEREKPPTLSRKAVPRVLSIAGSDSGAGAGIQADLKTCSARGVFCLTALTAVTAQNTIGVQNVLEISPDFVEKQLKAVFGDIGVDVVKTGMIPDSETVHVICDFLRNHEFRALVVDPVLVSTSGHKLAKPSVLAAIREILLPLADIVTPNLAEAMSILGWSTETAKKITSIEDMKNAAKEIHLLGPKFVLVKGGHLESSDSAIDVLFDGSNFEIFSSPRIKTTNTHGTGCTLSSAIASELAKGHDMVTAVKNAKAYITEILEQSKFHSIGGGVQGPMNHFPAIANWRTVPSSHGSSLSATHATDVSERRGNFQASDLLLYAVTDSGMNAKWNRSMAEAVQGALDGGATFLQIREKHANTGDFIASAAEAVSLAKKANVPIVINDRLDVALAVDADGVHIGQSDMPAKLARSLLGPSKIIGVSAKTVEQARKAFLEGADYVGVGGVFPTNTKQGNITIGVEGLAEVCRGSELPVVAIGGIKGGNLGEVFGSGAGEKLFGVAIVSGIFDQEDVKEATRSLKEKILDCRE